MLEQTVASKLSRLIAEDPQLRQTAVEIGIIDRQRPGDQIAPGATPLEVARRFIERTVETRPSVLGSLGLNAIDLLSWDVAFDRGADRSAGKTAHLTVVFTDLEGFTRYTAEHGDAVSLSLLADHHRTALPIIRSWGGRVVKRLGDGLMLVFTDPGRAVLAAVELVAAEPAPLRLRVGGHTGEAVVTGDDVLGHVVNIAARVTDQATGGQALITADLHDAVGALADIRFTGPSVRSVKGIDEPISVYLVERCPMP